MLGRIFGKPETRTVQATDWGTWPGEGGTTAWSGQRVTTDSALQLLTVYGCVRLITDSISTLPVDVFRKAGDEKVEIPAPLWLREPTVDLDFTAWCTQVLTSLLLHGNAFLWVTRSSSMQIVEVLPLDPCKVEVKRVNSRKTYWIGGQPFPGEIVHIKGMMLPGTDLGMSPLEYARQSIGLGLAALDFGSKGFEHEWNMPGVIEMPYTATPDIMKDTADTWRRKRTKGGRGLPGVLQNGAVWKPTGVTNEQAQFLATRQWTSAEIAGQVFLVDPSDLGIPVVGSSLTYANLEQRNIRRLQVTLLPWIVRLEAAVSALLANPRYIKLNTNALLRADLKTRYESYSIGLAGAPFLLDSEPRAWEDLPPASMPEPPAPPPVAPVEEAPPEVPAA
jgi:HK97 family phage portal protein